MQSPWSTGEVLMYIAGTQEAVNAKTLALVEQNGKPTDRITATLLEGARELASDVVQYIVVQPDSFYHKLQFVPQVRNALMARGVYYRTDMNEFGLQLVGYEELVELNIDLPVRQLLSNASGILGFNAALYQDYTRGGPDHYLGAFSGSDDLTDWDDNFFQGTGGYSVQYLAAMQIGDELRGNPALSSNLKMVGHSLGGGLATAAAVFADATWETFNAAGLQLATITGPSAPQYANAVANYNAAIGAATHLDWDILTIIQKALSPITTVPALGSENTIDGPYDAEVTIGFVTLTISVAGLPGWIVAIGKLGLSLGPLGLAHKMDVLLQGILMFDGENLSGYTYGGTL